MKVAHGSLADTSTHFLAEISQALVLHSAEEVQPCGWSCTGQPCSKMGTRTCRTYIVYILERAKKLAFHKKPVDDDELISSIFLKGLQPCVSTCPSPFCDSWHLHALAAPAPAMAAELAKLKSAGVSQSMFPATMSPGTGSVSKAPCRQFTSKGACRFGASCKFSHAATPRASQPNGPQLPSSR